MNMALIFTFFQINLSKAD